MLLDAATVGLALKDAADIWSLADLTLYDLCQEHWGHSDLLEVVAKLLLIGRAYGVAPERRPNATQFLTDFYRDHLAVALMTSDLDSLLSPLRSTRRLTDSELPAVLAVHSSLLRIFKSATGHSNRSLASKYLHFHVPDLFPMYDSYAVKALASWKPRSRPSRAVHGESDPEYKRFVLKWLDLRDSLEHDHGTLLTPRQLDRILLGNAGSVRPPESTIRSTTQGGPT